MKSQKVKKINNNNNFILWIMGPTSSGKTTVAQHMMNYLRKTGKPVIHYDGDEIRNFFGQDFGFSETNRLKVVCTLVHLANKALDAGMYVVVSALTAHRDARNYVRKNVKKLILVYLNCSVDKCMERDPKGLYEKARNGEIQTLIGFNSQYLPIEDPDIILDTETKATETSFSDLIEHLRVQGYQI